MVDMRYSNMLCFCMSSVYNREEGAYKKKSIRNTTFGYSLERAAAAGLGCVAHRDRPAANQGKRDDYER